MRRIATAADVRTGFKEANDAFYRVNNLKTSLEYLSRSLDRGAGRESVGAFKERVKASIAKVLADYEALDLRKAQTALDKAEAVADEVLGDDALVKATDALDEVKEDFALFAEDTFKTMDSATQKLRDLETAHPEIGGHQYDQFVRGLESLADDAFGYHKMYGSPE